MVINMFFVVYFLISEDKKKTYVGFSDNLDRRIQEHLNKKVKTTKNFGNFSWQILEKCNNIRIAREAEKYWKSCTGRKKIKIIFENIK